MAKDLNGILLSAIEENKIKEKTPDKLPLNPTAEGWSGQEVRRFLAKSLIDNEGSFLAEFKKKLIEIKAQFEDVFGEGDGNIQGQIDDILISIENVEQTYSSLVETNLNGYDNLNAIKVDKTLTILGIDLQDNITLDEFKTALRDATTFTNGLMSALDKQNLAQTMLDIQDIFTNKADKTALAVTDQNIVNLQNDKVNKTQTIMGLDFQDNITRTEVVNAIGEATQILSGLMSITDKQRLDALHAMLGVTPDADNVVNTINEIMEIFATYPEGADILTALNGKVDKVAGKQLSTNDLTDVLKNNYDVAYTHSEIVDGSNPHNTKFVNIADKPTTRDGYGITDVYTKPETYTQLEINNLLDNLSAVKGLKSTLLTPSELSNDDTISTNLLTNNGALVIFTATNTSTGEIDSDTVPVSTIITGKKFVFFDNQEVVFTIGETNSTFETSEGVTLKINLLYLDSENTQAVAVEFDGSLTNYLENQENVQSAISKLDEELKTTNDNSSNHITDINNPHSVTKAQVGLGNVDNTSDLNKPISTLTQNALNDKSNVGHTHTKSEITDLIEATQLLSGLMSATDKQRLDVLHALLEEDTANNVVDSINEVLEIFNNYPEGADLVSALANKVDKVEGKQLSTNDYTNTDKQSVEKIPTIEQDILDLESDKVDKIEGKGLSTEDYTTNEKNKLAELTVGITTTGWGTATKTLTLFDANKLILCVGTSDQTLTIPTNDSVPFPIGTMITFLLISPSPTKVTFSSQIGVDITSMDSLVELATPHGMASLIKIFENTWQLVGALE